MNAQKRPRARRSGYILLETVVSGVIVATAVIGLLGQLGNARVSGIAASREQTAARLAAAELEAKRGQVATVAPGTSIRTAQVGKGSYKVVTTVSDEQLDTIPGPGGLVLQPRYLEVKTVVAFRVDGRERTARASTRLYR